ncbi:extracellular calcium-sensing receptor-like [Megalops cyprinoides]|uniref:extracellular calcium-sensing receptor-like n=1 Tax=Megalops cyprinoides TaxID=118141 RepID=UPI001864C24C|nr:extracellular calcium-sensing receptor-like [Megalops cyprinoides]
MVNPSKTESSGEFKFAQTVIFTVQEINRKSELLPGITLGYRIYNGCGTLNLLRAAMAAVTGHVEQQGETCTMPRVKALIGHSSSGPSQTISKILTPFHVPVISHLAICECLSNRQLYPTFFRTVPSDYFQIIALVQLMKHYGWTWVGLVYGVGTYAEEGSAAFIREAKKEDICIEYILRFSRTYTQNKVIEMAQAIKSATSKVALAFMSKSYFKSFLEKMEGMNLTGIQWIDSESWITSGDLLTDRRVELLQGAMGFAITESQIPGLPEFLLSLKPSDTPDSTFLRSFWETVWLKEDGHKSVFNGRILGFMLLAFSILGISLTATVGIISFWHRNTPIIRANNSELRFLLLFSLKLCFLCSLTFIGRPLDWSCMLRHTAFGITFVLCISCVLGKTIVVLMAFRATLPGSNVMKWFGPLQQRLSIFAFTLIQVLICILWLTISPPYPNKNMKHYKEKIILECDVGSAVGFWAVLGYIGLLSVLCFALAFLAYKVPLGEARFLSV